MLLISNASVARIGSVFSDARKNLTQRSRRFSVRSVLRSLEHRGHGEQPFNGSARPSKVASFPSASGHAVASFTRKARIGLLCGAFFSPCILVTRLSAQGLSPEALLQPPTSSWPTYNGEYSGRRYSTLDQINSQNIGSLTLAWRFRADAPIKSTPLEVNGVLYLTTPDNLWAVDAS